MPFTDRFQLLGLKRDEGARTYEAREIATGRPVFVHLFADCTTPFNRALLAKLDALPEEERRRILERGEHEGGMYLVTDRLAEYPGLREWLKAKHEDRPSPLSSAGAWQIRPPVEPSIVSPRPAVSPLGNSGEQTLRMPVPAELANDPGEFTRQFAVPVAPPAAPPVLRPTAPPPPAAKEPGEFTRLFAAPPPKPQAPAKPPGEFTKLFQAPPRPPSPRVPTPPQNAAQQPGEFTQMLQAQRPAAPTPPASKSSLSGEFARFFQSPTTPAQHAAPLTPPRPPSHAQDAGEFTQIFGQGDLPSPPPPPAPAAPPNPASANATQVFAAPGPPNIPPRAPQQGPGEYTQMFAKPAPLTFGQAPAGPRTLHLPGAAPQKRNSSLLPLLFVIGAAVLLIAAGIVYLVMRNHTS